VIKERWVAIVCAGLILLKGISLAEQRCTAGSGRINGSVTDPTGAVIPGAEVRIANGPAGVSDETGKHILPYISPGTITISVRAEGFSDKTLRVST
jgi:hypothetical protein